jgi:DNA-binding NarL/FixJ family response regulator
MLLGDLLVSVTEPVETSTLRWALETGANGVVWNEEVEEVLDLTVRAVHAGQIVFPLAFRRRQNIPSLTNREKQVLSLVIMGFTNRQIAEQLYVSDSTVKSHLNTAYRKLGVGSRAEAAHVITDPDEGIGTGILAITGGGLARGRRSAS